MEIAVVEPPDKSFHLTSMLFTVRDLKHVYIDRFELVVYKSKDDTTYAYVTKRKRIKMTDRIQTGINVFDVDEKR